MESMYLHIGLLFITYIVGLLEKLYLMQKVQWSNIKVDLHTSATLLATTY